MSIADALGRVALLVGVIWFGYFGYQKYSTPAAPALEQQRMCAEQATKLAKDKDSGAVTEGWSHTSHYNQTYGRCFVETRRLIPGNGSTVVLTIWDAFEGAQYAYYSQVNSDEPTCILYLPDQEAKVCKLQNDWINAAKPLMGHALVIN